MVGIITFLEAAALLLLLHLISKKFWANDLKTFEVLQNVGRLSAQQGKSLTL